VAQILRCIVKNIVHAESRNIYTEVKIIYTEIINNTRARLQTLKYRLIWAVIGNGNAPRNNEKYLFQNEVVLYWQG
jgi:hypothetical protein